MVKIHSQILISILCSISYHSTIEEVQDILRPAGDVRPGGGGGAGVVVPVLEDRAAEPGDEAPGK